MSPFRYDCAGSAGLIITFRCIPRSARPILIKGKRRVKGLYIIYRCSDLHYCLNTVYFRTSSEGDHSLSIEIPLAGIVHQDLIHIYAYRLQGAVDITCNCYEHGVPLHSEITDLIYLSSPASLSAALSGVSLEYIFSW